MRILVTGGAGFIGSELVRQLLADGHAVTVLDALTYAGREENLAEVAGVPGYAFVRADVRDPAAVDAVLPGHEAVLHLAAESHVDRSIADPAPFVTTNVLGTQVLLDAARRHRVGRFVQVSTDEVYGSIEHGAWREEQPLAPNSPYAAGKAAADLLVLAAHRTHGLDAVVTRCSNNYGPRQHPEKLIPLFATNLLRGLPVPLYGDGGAVRDWVHVADHCRGLRLALERGRAGEVYHLGGTAELSNKELTGLLLEAFGAGWESVRYVADRPGHDRRYALDGTKARRELGYVPEVPFADGLAATLEWYRTHPEWWEPLKSGIAHGR